VCEDELEEGFFAAVVRLTIVSKKNQARIEGNQVLQFLSRWAFLGKDTS
jgi:hypothetical protein